MSYFAGIDVSKSKLDIGIIKDLSTGKKKTKSKVANTQVGHQQIGVWLQEAVGANADDITVVIEPTGVYHEAISLFLYKLGFKVILANPGKAKQYAQAYGQLHKTDKLDSLMLARYGASGANSLSLWEPEPPEARELKVLLRRLDALEKDLLRELNRQEATQSGLSTDQVMESLESMITRLREEIKRLTDDIDNHINRHPQLKHNRKLLESIKGIGPVMSRELVSLFACNRFTDARQVAAYIGVIPRINESGNKQGKTTLSKQGPSSLRAKLYMAAISASQHNPDIVNQRQRLLRHGKTKMQALGAAMRKLIQICFGVIKHQSEYQPQVLMRT